MITRVAPLPLPEIDSLLHPISAEEPSGESLRFDPVYDEIKRLREEDDPTLPQGVWQRELKRADWPAVAELAAETLATRSKDLQIAAWLTEAWVRLHAFGGLAHGVRLITALCENFWETLHPAMEDESVDPRVAPIAWLGSDKFLLGIKSVPITAPTGEESVAYAWKTWETSRRTPSEANVLLSASLTPAPFFAKCARDLAASLAALDALKGWLVERLGERDAPSVAPLRDTLAGIARFVARVRQDSADIEEAAAMELVPQPPDDGPAPAEAAELPSRPGSPIESRADAYQRLREASDFLLRTEPHSPVPYLVRRAISWGNMTLGEVLEQLLQKNADLATIYTLLGIKESEKKGR